MSWFDGLVNPLRPLHRLSISATTKLFPHALHCPRRPTARLRFPLTLHEWFVHQPPAPRMLGTLYIPKSCCFVFLLCIFSHMENMKWRKLGKSALWKRNLWSGLVWEKKKFKLSANIRHKQCRKDNTDGYHQRVIYSGLWSVKLGWAQVNKSDWTTSGLFEVTAK